MKLRFWKKDSNYDQLPEEVRTFTAEEQRERMGIAWMVGIASLIVVILFATLLFFTGRWAYNKINKKDSNKTNTTQNENTNKPEEPVVNKEEEPIKAEPSTPVVETPTTPTVNTTTPATGTTDLPRTGPDLDL